MKIKNPEMGDSGKSWNVVTGCDKYSDGCKNCYAEDIVDWLKGMGQKVYIKHGFNLTMHHDRIELPLNLKKFSKKPKRPAKSFVTEMGDLFHERVTNDFIVKVFEVMLKVPQHRFYVLTKRAVRLGELGSQLPWKPWIWAGVTVESDKYIDRIDHLKKLPSDVNKFIMMEPLLSSMPELDLEGINWVVVGGETNKKMKFRNIKKEWLPVLEIRLKMQVFHLCSNIGQVKHIMFKEALLEGKIWNEYPESLQVNIDWN